MKLNKINLSNECTLLSLLLKEYFDAVDFSGFDDFVKEVFNFGLKESQFWADAVINPRVSSAFNQTCFNPLKPRKNLIKKEDPCYVYDALFIFNESVFSELNYIHTKQESEFPYRPYLSELTSQLIKKYPLMEVSSKALSKEEQADIVDSSSLYFNTEKDHYKIAEKLSPDTIEYYRNDLGTYLPNRIISIIFCHAISCMTRNNTIDLINTMIAVLSQYKELPFNADNGQEILNKAIDNKMILLISKLDAFNFSSTQEMEEEKSSDIPEEDDIASESFHDKIMRELLNPTDDEKKKSEERSLARVNKLMNSIEEMKKLTLPEAV